MTIWTRCCSVASKLEETKDAFVLAGLGLIGSCLNVSHLD
jgi:hypothetical protein